MYRLPRVRATGDTLVKLPLFVKIRQCRFRIDAFDEYVDKSGGNLTKTLISFLFSLSPRRFESYYENFMKQTFSQQNYCGEAYSRSSN